MRRRLDGTSAPPSWPVPVNQAVLRIYALILTGVFALVLAVWPRRARPFRGEGAVRFLLAFALGALFILFGFHRAGEVDRVSVIGDHLWVRERFEGRRFGEEAWTRVRLSDGVVASASSPEDLEPRAATSTGALRVLPSLIGRVQRPEGDGAVPVGPVLAQPVVAYATPRWAVLAAREEPGRPATTYLSRIDRDGTIAWRIESEAVGLAEGRLVAGRRIEGGDLILVLQGLKAERGWGEVLTQADHALAARLDPETGRVLWTSAF